MAWYEASLVNPSYMQVSEGVARIFLFPRPAACCVLKALLPKVR